MNSRYLFLSYSRAQLYFAESVALALQNTDISTWFDLQRLDPGTDWQRSIQQALTTCTGLVLIASRESLRSPYVQLEWEAAQAASKPVYLVWYEAVDLP